MEYTKYLLKKACKCLEIIDFEMEYMYSSDGYTFLIMKNSSMIFVKQWRNKL